MKVRAGAGAASRMVALRPLLLPLLVAVQLQRVERVAAAPVTTPAPHLLFIVFGAKHAVCPAACLHRTALARR